MKAYKSIKISWINKLGFYAVKKNFRSIGIVLQAILWCTFRIIQYNCNMEALHELENELQGKKHEHGVTNHIANGICKFSAVKMPEIITQASEKAKHMIAISPTCMFSCKHGRHETK